MNGHTRNQLITEFLMHYLKTGSEDDMKAEAPQAETADEKLADAVIDGSTGSEIPTVQEAEKQADPSDLEQTSEIMNGVSCDDAQAALELNYTDTGKQEVKELNCYNY